MARSLYERLGGEKAIPAVIDAFVTRVSNDQRINAKFARSDIGRLKTMLVDQVSEATGGLATYGGRGMKEAHRGMGVTSGEFDALVQDLVATLDAFRVGKGEKDELLGVLGTLRGDIVEIDSPQTGRPLPPTYAPAPPLMRA